MWCAHEPSRCLAEHIFKALGCAGRNRLSWCRQNAHYLDSWARRLFVDHLLQKDSEWLLPQNRFRCFHHPVRMPRDSQKSTGIFLSCKSGLALSDEIQSEWSYQLCHWTLQRRLSHCILSRGVFWSFPLADMQVWKSCSLRRPALCCLRIELLACIIRRFQSSLRSAGKSIFCRC